MAKYHPPRVYIPASEMRLKSLVQQREQARRTGDPQHQNDVDAAISRLSSADKQRYQEMLNGHLGLGTSQPNGPSVA